MTAPGGGEPHRDQPGPWQQYQHPPVDPRAPLNYPDYPPTGPQPPPYGGYPPPPPPYGPPMYPYDPYQSYSLPQTNGLAVASLVTSIAGVFLGIPLAVFCFLGFVIPVIGAVLGIVALSQIKRTGEQGRGMAIAGIAIGAATTAFVVLGMMVVAAAAFHSPMFVR